MKKTLGTLFLIFTTGYLTYAQTQQGNFLLGGAFGASFGTQKIETPGGGSSVNVTERRTTSVTFTPQTGFFIVDGFALGLHSDINSTTRRDKNNDAKSTAAYTAIGPLVRYYFPVNIFLDGRIGFGSGKGNAFGEENILTYSFGAGYAAFLNDHVALEPIIRYRGVNYTAKNNDEAKNKTGVLEIAISLQIYL